MHYIVFDLEFNQDFSSLQKSECKSTQYPFEIIQIGAVKLDSAFQTIATFNRYIKPTIYSKISPFITELTGITTEQLLGEETFPEIYSDYISFINEPDSMFCVWGMADIKALHKNAQCHQLSTKYLPKLFINLQPYASMHFNLPPKNLLRLQNVVELLEIPISYDFHNALYDAYYTAEILKKIFNSFIQPKVYDPSYVIIRPKQVKKVINFEKLMRQFEKMYDRDMTEEEQAIIKLAYKMGKTKQFLE